MESAEAEADHLVFKCRKTRERLRIKFEALD